MTNTLKKPATISEKELWALFADATFTTRSSMGPIVETFQPDAVLRNLITDRDMSEFANEVADSIAASNRPGDELESVFQTISEYHASLEMVRSAFDSLKDTVRLEEGHDGEERFSVPVFYPPLP